MSRDIVVIGYGPCGRETVRQLHARGCAVRVAQRREPQGLPDGVTFVACDVLDLASLRRAFAGAAQVVLTVGFPYDGKVWMEAWPITVRNLLEACEENGARIVFFDNLYMYGPQTAPLNETMPLTNYGLKPAARAEASRIWQEQAIVPVAALRSPDFYGPRVMLSHLGATGLAAIAKGKRASFAFSPEMLHDYAYVPDIGRAIISLLDAPDDVFGQVWHMPCAPTKTSRELLELGAQAAGKQLRLSVLSSFMLAGLAPFVNSLGNLKEMAFQWDRPFVVDASKWRTRFWSDVTPFEEGVAATVASFQA